MQVKILQYFRPSLSYHLIVFKTFVLSIFEWLVNTGFTVQPYFVCAISEESDETGCMSDLCWSPNYSVGTKLLHCVMACLVMSLLCYINQSDPNILLD